MPYDLREGLREDAAISPAKQGEWFLRPAVENPGERFLINAVLRCPGCGNREWYFLTAPPNKEDFAECYCRACAENYGVPDPHTEKVLKYRKE